MDFPGNLECRNFTRSLFFGEARLLLGNGFDHQTVNGFLGINMGLVYSPRRCISVDIVYL